MATATSTEQAKQAVQSALAEHKDTAASSLGSFANALRKAARESGDGGGQVTKMAEWTAEGLERASSTLRGKDIRAVAREVESFARNQPVAFFCAAAAAGFLATRFLKSGATTQQAGTGTPWQRDPNDTLSGGSAIGKTDGASTIPF